MHRFYADQELSDENRLFLDRGDSHHALKVLRLHTGDEAEVFFHEQRFLSVLDSAENGVVCFRPFMLLPSTEPRLSITLFQGLPKGDKMEWIIQKSVELGVFPIVPVVFSRCVVRLDSKEAEKKLERWRKIAREAGKQSGRCHIPEVTPPAVFTALPSLFSSCEQVAVPWEECLDGGPVSFVRRNPSLSSLGIVIGPEGGITAEEMKELVRNGCAAITLGKRILRTETAGLAAISAFSGLYGEME